MRVGEQRWLPSRMGFHRVCTCELFHPVVSPVPSFVTDLKLSLLETLPLPDTEHERCLDTFHTLYLDHCRHDRIAFAVDCMGQVYPGTKDLHVQALRLCE